ELHATRDETKAKENVLERFGNPATIALKLWSDAMWEKIMSQRITLLVVSATAAACLFASTLAWLAFREGREVNAAILARLESLGHAAGESESSTSLDWNPVRVKLVLDKPGGVPAAGYKASLQGKVYGADAATGPLQLLDELTGATGEIDFGLIRFGVYSLVVSTPWGEHHTTTLGVRPGRAAFQEVVCPSNAPTMAEVSVSVDWPADLRDRDLFVVAVFEPVKRAVAGGTWAQNPSPADNLLVRHDGQCALLSGANLTAPSQLTSNWHAARYTVEAKLSNPVTFGRSFSRTEGTCTLSSILVLYHNADFGPRTFQAVAAFPETGVPPVPPAGGLGWGGGMTGLMGGMSGLFQVIDNGQQPEDAAERLPANNGPRNDNESVEFAVDVWPQTFDVLPRQPNHWRIALPSTVLQQVRESLAQPAE
ncbi:MAG: hypothetical protein ACT4QC_21455, partial [Planctomycetaceae bacterium]